jgi:hypothetical protein
LAIKYCRRRDISRARRLLPKQFSIDALYPHREHLPAKVRKFIDMVAKNFNHIDWDSYAREVDRLGNPIDQAIVSNTRSSQSKKVLVLDK